MPSPPTSRPVTKNSADTAIALRGPLRSIHVPPNAAARPSMTMAMENTTAMAVSLVSKRSTSGVLNTDSA